MKIRLALPLVLLSILLLNSCKSGTSATTTPDVGLVTPVGTPNGTPTSATIDATGGTLMSSDGRLEMIVPAGALSTATLITVQPITNECPLGAGDGFDLSPHGQKFNVPITLRFHYDSTDLLGTNFNALEVATQKDDGIWYAYNNITLDSGAGTVSVQASHFSGDNLFARLQIIPHSSEINVNEFEALKVFSTPNASDYKDPDGFLSALGQAFNPFDRTKISWKMVSGPASGSPANGFLSPTDGASTVYTAPATTSGMGSNPAFIEADVWNLGRYRGQYTANVNVLEDGVKSYRIDIDYEGRKMVDVEDVYYDYSQKASFIATVYPNDDTVHYGSIVNEVGKISNWTERNIVCTHEVVTPGDYIHIMSFITDFISRSSGQPDRINPIIGGLLTSFTYISDCSGHKTTHSGQSVVEDYEPSKPFLLDGTTQTLIDPVNSNATATVTFTLTPQ